MKTEKEIRKELAEMEECFIRRKNDYIMAEDYGYILALKWVLEEKLL